MNKRFLEQKMYGTTLLGARGQLVIPADARKDLRLKPGDRIIVVGRFNKMLGLVRAKDLDGLIQTMMNQIKAKKINKRMKSKIIKQIKDSYEILAKN